MIDYFRAVHSLVGGGVQGPSDGPVSDYTFDDGQTPPTEKAIQAKLKELENEYKKQTYARSRADAYPSYADQLDYIFHHGLDKWKSDIVQPVKDKFPKPK